MLDKKTKKQLKDILYKYLSKKEYRMFVFGSRASGENSRWSDIDVGVWGEKKMPLEIKFQIEDDLENSDIPYKVDLVDFKNTSKKFRQIALNNFIPL